MKKYSTHYSIAITLFFASIASAMDHPSPANRMTEALNDIFTQLQAQSSNAGVASMRGNSSILADSITPSEDIYRRRSAIFTYRNDTLGRQPHPVPFASKTRIFLLLKAAHENDLNMVTTLFRYSADAQEYNKNIPLITLPKKLLGNILICNDNSIIQSINAILSLSATCTYFNNKLEELGNLLQCYDQEAKNALLAKRLECSDDAYWGRRQSFLLLVYGGADHNTCRYMNLPLIKHATNNDDITMITTLFRYGADANLKNRGNEPIFFYSETPPIAQLFADNGANLNALTYHRNVLNYCLIQHNDKPELIKFYIDKGVDTRILDSKKRSLLHNIGFADIKDNDIGLKIVTLLLDKICDMINLVDDKGNTPLDLLIDNILPKKNIIALFRENGAKTSQELKLIELAKKEKAPTAIQQNKPASCIICLGVFGKDDKQVKLPCSNNHPTDIHMECYEDLLQHSGSCPLCRAQLQ